MERRGSRDHIDTFHICVTTYLIDKSQCPHLCPFPTEQRTPSCITPDRESHFNLTTIDLHFPSVNPEYISAARSQHPRRGPSGPELLRHVASQAHHLHRTPSSMMIAVHDPKPPKRRSLTCLPALRSDDAQSKRLPFHNHDTRAIALRTHLLAIKGHLHTSKHLPIESGLPYPLHCQHHNAYSGTPVGSVIRCWTPESVSSMRPGTPQERPARIR
jgi:hypothetical protein